MSLVCCIPDSSRGLSNTIAGRENTSMRLLIRHQPSSVEGVIISDC